MNTLILKEILCYVEVSVKESLLQNRCLICLLDYCMECFHVYPSCKMTGLFCRCLMKYGGDMGRKQQHDCMSVRVNHLGTQLIALYRRRPLMLYNINSPTPLCKFSSSSTEYLNCCTMKSCCFGGDKDQVGLFDTQELLSSTGDVCAQMC